MVNWPSTLKKNQNGVRDNNWPRKGKDGANVFPGENIKITRLEKNDLDI